MAEGGRWKMNQKGGNIQQIRKEGDFVFIFCFLVDAQHPEEEEPGIPGGGGILGEQEGGWGEFDD